MAQRRLQTVLILMLAAGCAHGTRTQSAKATECPSNAGRGFDWLTLEPCTGESCVHLAQSCKFHTGVCTSDTNCLMLQKDGQEAAPTVEAARGAAMAKPKPHRHKGECDVCMPRGFNWVTLNPCQDADCTAEATEHGYKYGGCEDSQHCGMWNGGN